MYMCDVVVTCVTCLRLIFGKSASRVKGSLVPMRYEGRSWRLWSMCRLQLHLSVLHVNNRSP